MQWRSAVCVAASLAACCVGPAYCGADDHVTISIKPVAAKLPRVTFRDRLRAFATAGPSATGSAAGTAAPTAPVIPQVMPAVRPETSAPSVAPTTATVGTPVTSGGPRLHILIQKN